jgi:hypothetical protein
MQANTIPQGYPLYAHGTIAAGDQPGTFAVVGWYMTSVQSPMLLRLGVEDDGKLQLSYPESRLVFTRSPTPEPDPEVLAELWRDAEAEGQRDVTTYGRPVSDFTDGLVDPEHAEAETP